MPPEAEVNRQPSSSDIQALFDRIAPVYDRLNDRLSFGLHRVWKLMAVKWCEPQAGDVALDLCCGSGDLALLLAQRVGKTGKVVGVDFSPEQLAIASQRTAAIDWIVADALSLPFAENFFDCATMGYGLRNVTDIPRCLQELRRVLKPGATAAILDFHRPSQPLMQAFQQWYLQNLVVPTAQSFGLTQEYAYIAPSLERFPTSKEQVKLACQTGFESATHYKIAGGIMGVLVLTNA
ncbi:MAG: bifunctional demethylmenaquinone methyltransferase/2-methoxy-6-polyprenyl-1,4-benzoquinol methylase UbiE [Cyanophyceae cyanobacterium]